MCCAHLLFAFAQAFSFFFYGMNCVLRDAFNSMVHLDAGHSLPAQGKGISDFI
jgi:hypothetical protein